MRCVRVYPNGDCKVLEVPESQVNDWVSLNQRIRPGNALFVGTECKDLGISGISVSQGMAIVKELQSDTKMWGFDWNSSVYEPREYRQRFTHIVRPTK